MSSNDIIVRLRMLGASAFNSAAKGSAKAIEGIGSAAENVGSKASGFIDKAAGPIGSLSVLAGQATAALGAAGVAAAGMGLKFNASMEQSTVAFTNLLGSSGEAKDMLDELYDIAAKTPFEFPQLTQSTQRLLGFGMAAKDVIPTMNAVGDAVAAAGGGAEQIDRVSTALGQMQAKGKVSSEELLQLAESGVPALKILQDELGLTGTQLSKKLQKGAIDAKTGIDALVTGIEKRYKGMASAQSKTFSGMMSTLKDQATQILGRVTLPLFNFLRDSLLPKVQDVTDAIGKWADAGGIESAMAALKAGATKGVGPATEGFTGMNAILVKVGDIAAKAFGIFKDVWNQLMGALKPAMPFFTNILLPLITGIAKGVLGSVVAAFKVLIPIIKIVATVLGWLGQKAAPFKKYIEWIGVFIGVVFGPAILKAIGTLGKLGGIFKVIAFVAKVAAIPIRILAGIFGALFKVVGKVFTILGKVGGIAAKVAGKLKAPFENIPAWFLDFGKKIITAIANGIKASAGVIMDALTSIVPGPMKKVLKKVPGMSWLGAGATGLGPVSRPGFALVGERGPEIVSLNRGASVIPMPSIAMGNTIVPVNIDGREVMRVVAQRTADRRARR